MYSPDVEHAFDTFAETNDPHARQRALTDLVTHKALPKFADDPRFHQGFARWKAAASDAGAAAVVRLLAVSELVRIAQVVKRMAPLVATEIQSTFATPLGPLALLEEADQRLNVARACRSSNAPWLPAYLARSIASEDTGEKARQELLATLLGKAGSISEALNLMAAAFSDTRFETDAPGDSMAKRLVRTLSAFRSAILDSTIDAGRDAGKSLDELIRAAIAANGKIRDERSAIELTREIALTLHDIVRTHFSMCTEVSAFSVLRYCRSLFPTVSWPPDLRSPMSHLEQDISEALVLLGRQGIPSQALREQLDLACGLKERAQAVATGLAERHQELPESVREWLRRGRFVEGVGSSDLLEESLLRSVDAAIGLALIEVQKLGALRETLDSARSTLEIYDTAAANAVQKFGSQAHATTAAVVDVARRRRLDLLGAEGEEIPHSQKYFDLASPISRQTVTVRRPAVVRRVTPQSVAEVIVKGVVE